MCDRKVFATHSSDLSTNTSENAQADVRAAGLWTRGEGSYFDVKDFHPDAPSVQIKIANQPLRPEHMVRNAVASHLKKQITLCSEQAGGLRHTRTTCRETQSNPIANGHGYKLCCEVCSSNCKRQ